MGSSIAASPWRSSVYGGAFPLRRRNCSFLIFGLKMSRAKVQMANPSTYSTTVSTDLPLYEIPGASFDEYLEDRPRVFEAIFPDKKRAQRLNEEEWRVQMLPIDFLFVTALPTVDIRLRCKSNGMGYPLGVPRGISKVLELDIVRWELKGLDDMFKPSHFSLEVKGALYPDRKGPRNRLKGQLLTSVSLAVPQVLAVVPENIRREVAEMILWRVVQNMKDRVNGSLTADYSVFKRERVRALA